MPLRDTGICYDAHAPDKQNEPSIKVWKDDNLILSSDSLKIELEHSILHIKDNFITIEHK